MRAIDHHKQSSERVRILLLASFALVILTAHSVVYGEIYTYEKNGVIVISSEPPPRPRKQRKRSAISREVERARATKRQRTTRDKARSLKTKSQRRKVGQPRAKRKSDRLRLPRVLRREQTLINELSRRYHLPPRLLPSVSLSCLSVFRSDRKSNSNQDEGIKYTCNYD